MAMVISGKMAKTYIVRTSLGYFFSLNPDALTRFKPHWAFMGYEELSKFRSVTSNKNTTLVALKNVWMNAPVRTQHFLPLHGAAIIHLYT